MLYRSICHQVSNQADKLALLAIILLLVYNWFNPNIQSSSNYEGFSWHTI